MAENSFASLNPTLLARKGGAKPAMRPQLGTIGSMGMDGNTAPNLEDLGWNDLGDDTPERDAEVIHLTPTAANEQDSDHATPEEPVVREQQADIAESFAQPSPAPKSQAAKKPNAGTSKKRAAFTLRLDAERHLRLRLASTVQNRSAQTIVTEALDAMLAAMPELEALAAKVERK